MKKNIRIFVYVMIAIVVAGGIYLWSLRDTGEDVLSGLDPGSYDVQATCVGVDGNNLICNGGGDIFLFLDGSSIFLQKSAAQIKENGDEETKVSYRKFSLEELVQTIEAKNEVPVLLWMTQNGKVKTIMVLEETFENRSASLSNLEGLDPSGYTSTNVILSMNADGMDLAPFGYTEEEADKFSDLLSRYSFARNVRFYKAIVTISVDEDGNRQRNIQYAKDSYSALKDRLKGEDLTAHIWLNAYGNISAVLVHEEEIILL